MIFGGYYTIIDPDFDGWIEGASFAAIADGKFTSTLLKYNKAGAVVHTASQSTSVPTQAQSGHRSNYSVELDVTTADSSVDAGDFSYLSNFMTGHDYQALDGNEYTLSFWVYSSVTGTHSAAFTNSGKDRSYVAEYSVSAANTWENKTVTLTFNASGGTFNFLTGVGLEIRFAQMCGSTFQTSSTGSWQTGNFICSSNQVNGVGTVGNKFRIAQLMLNQGPNALPFNKPLTSTVNDQVAYYFQRHGNEIIGEYLAAGHCQNSSKAKGVLVYSRDMRVGPTVTFSGQTDFDVFQGASFVASVVMGTGQTTTKKAVIAADATNICVQNGGLIIVTKIINAYVDLDARH
ncbi:hypothetical protein UR09_05290 [Candidatus Nitromaritima sp. SCGC AAA799-A02]|nr:hypothetical protein UR09_05290 [Candidatus Nitromaritima sp. SCGC AAA799-A02]